MSFCCTSFSHKLRTLKLVTSIVHLNTRFLNYCNLQVFQKDLLWRSWFLVFIICTDQLNICMLLRFPNKTNIILINMSQYSCLHKQIIYEVYVNVTANQQHNDHMYVCVCSFQVENHNMLMMWLYKPYLYCHNQRIYINVFE